MKSKFISTGLPVKGNKKRAEAMLLKARREFNPYNLLENANIPFSDFLTKWLKGRAASLGAATYTTYAYDVKNYIFPYFLDHAISVVNVTPKDLEGFYQYELQDDGASAEELLQFHEAITACLNYAKELGWNKENPAEEVNPCADQAPIRFDEFILEWLGHSDIGTTSNIYTHLDYSNKVSSANAILPAYPDNVCVGVIG